MSLLARNNMIQPRFYEHASRKPFDSNRASPSIEDELAVDILTNMIHMNDVPDLQRLALACLQTRLSIIAQKQDSLHMNDGRLSHLIAPEEQLIKSISISDLNSILSLVSPNGSKKRKSVFMETPAYEDETRSRSSSFDLAETPYSRNGYNAHDRNPRRRNSGPVYEFLSPGSQVRVLKTGQTGVVVGEKNGGWRIIEMVNSQGSKVYGTFRPSDMSPLE